MQTYSQAIAAGQDVDFPGGGQFHLLQTSAPVNVKFYGAMGQKLETAYDIQAGFRTRFVDKDGNNLLVRVQIFSATAQTVKIGITQGDAVYDRSQGDVNVVSGTLTRDDSWFYESNNEKAFMGNGFLTSTAGKYPNVQLWNPVASGIRAFVKNIQLKVDGTGDLVYLRMHTSALALLVNISYNNKYINKANPACLIRYDDNASYTIGTAIHRFDCANTLAFRGWPFPVADPIIVPPGYGIHVSNGIALSFLGVTFEWVEKA